MIVWQATWGCPAALTEGQALSFIRSRIAKGTIINADEGSSWDALHAQYEMKRVNHEEAYSLSTKM
jgi:ISXO2 transposase-like protein